MKLIATFAASMLIASGALAQTDVTGSSNTPSGVKGKPGAMTIKQASGGGAAHAPRTGRQPTKRAPHVSQGSSTPRGYAHATTSKGKGLTGASKSPTRPAAATRR